MDRVESALAVLVNWSGAVVFGSACSPAAVLTWFPDSDSSGSFDWPGPTRAGATHDVGLANDCGLLLHRDPASSGASSNA